MTTWEKIKNNSVMAFVGTPIFLFMSTYLVTTDDIEPTAGLVMGLIGYAIVLGTWIFGILKG